MDGIKPAAVLLIVAGALGMGYGGIDHVRRARLEPPMNWTLESRSINVPAWAGGTMIVAGLVLLASRSARGRF